MEYDIINNLRAREDLPMNKKQLTFWSVANATGNFKLKLVFIYQFKKIL